MGVHVVDHSTEAVPALDLDALRHQAEEFDQKSEEYARKAAGVRQIISGYLALNGEADSVLHRTFPAHRTIFEMRPQAEFGLRGPAAVLRVMAERPNDIWKVVDVKREMLRRGWAPTPKAVEASVKRLRERGEVVSIAYGRYKLVSETEASDNHEQTEAVVA